MLEGEDSPHLFPYLQTLGLPGGALQMGDSCSYCFETKAKFACLGVLEHDMTLLIHTHMRILDAAHHPTWSWPAEPSSPAALS